jgi:hypothetical protein
VLISTLSFFSFAYQYHFLQKLFASTKSPHPFISTLAPKLQEALDSKLIITTPASSFLNDSHASHLIGSLPKNIGGCGGQIFPHRPFLSTTSF